MELFNRRLERHLIRSMCSRKTDVSAVIVGSLTPEDFTAGACKEFFQRIRTVTRRATRTPYWDDMLEDTAISQEARRYFIGYQRRPILRLEEAQARIRSAVRYRRLRQFYRMADHIVDTLRQPRVDDDLFMDELSDSLNKIRSGTGQNVFTHIGTKNNADSLVREMLRGKAMHFIPSTFKAFDSRNIGFLRGSVVLLTSTTSGGKSAVAFQMAMNQAAQEQCRVAYVSLELGKKENIARYLANRGNTSLSDILNSKKLSQQDRKIIWKKYVRDKRLMQENEAGVTIVTPDEDWTVEDTLLRLKPYGYDAIYLDYMSLFKGMRTQDQWLKLGEATRFSKLFAEPNDAVIFVLAQLGGGGEVRYSRMMNEDVDYHIKWLYDADARASHILEMQVDKARMGQTFTFPLLEEFDKMRIHDLSKEEMEKYAREVSRGGGNGQEQQRPANGKGGGNVVDFRSRSREKQENRRREQQMDQDDYLTLD